jgi:hypothetical protein
MDIAYHKEVLDKPPGFRPNDKTANEHKLLEKHRQELEEGSAIVPEVRMGRGYATVGKSEARELGFSAEQARAGLLIPFYSPTGEISCQLKPDTPRSRRDKAVKYETRAGCDIVLDVHPSNNERLLLGNEPVYVVEGIKKADCAASSGRVAVGLSGVWNWGRKRKSGGAKYGRPQLLQDWDAIPLEGRTVYVCFDADYREKQNVALAMLRLAERLTERGAHVHIMNLPGPEKGLDDHVVSGGSLDDLERDARPFTPSDLIRYAAKTDKRIHAVVAGIADAMKIDDWTEPWSCTTHSLLRTLLELALLGGRYDRYEEGVEVVMGTRELRSYAAIGGLDTLSRHTEKLEDRGYIKKVTGDRKRGKANRYILKMAKGVPGTERPNFSKGISGVGNLNFSTTGSLIGEGNEVSNISVPDPGLANFAPHLRWPSPATASPSENDPDSKLPRVGAGPVNHPDDRPDPPSIYDADSEATPEVQAHAESEVALGKIVEMALHLILSWGGESSLRDLATATGVNDTSKMRKKLEAAGGVFDLDPKGKHGARVRLGGGWRRSLDERRERAGEFRRARQQAVRNRQARERFIERHREATEPEPPLAGPERVADMVAKADRRERGRPTPSHQAPLRVPARVRRRSPLRQPGHRAPAGGRPRASTGRGAQGFQDARKGRRRHLPPRRIVRLRLVR